MNAPATTAARGDLDLRPDVLVVGGGIAGFVAAARAREQGASVVLVKKPGGGTPSSSGAVDVADELLGLVPGPALDPLERGGRFKKAADVVAARHPRHPYARLAPRGNGHDRLRDALALLKQLAQSGGVELVERDDGCNHVVATQLGTVKRTALVQKTQLLDLAALHTGAGDDVLVGVIEPLDLAGFSARSVVHMLSWIAGQSQKRVQFTAIPVDRTLPGREVFASTFEMAYRLDDAKVRGAFADGLRAALRKQTRAPAFLLAPPVLGLDEAGAVSGELERVAGRPVKELLGLPPSAPGERLQRALTVAAKKLGVSVVEGAAVEAVHAGERVTAVHVEGQGFRAEMKPQAVVLAGGRYFGGGLVRDGDARDPLLRLPVVADGFVVGDSFIGDHLGPVPEAAHAIFRSGLAVDDALRPLDAAGRAAFDNVACAGAIVEGWDPARDGTGGAVAALLGLVAGERAAATAKGDRVVTE